MSDQHLSSYWKIIQLLWKTKNILHISMLHLTSLGINSSQPFSIQISFLERKKKSLVQPKCKQNCHVLYVI